MIGPPVGGGTCPNCGHSGLQPDPNPYQPVTCPDCHAPCYPIVIHPLALA